MARTLGIAASIAVMGVLPACQQLDSTPNVGPCPVAGVLFDVERLVEVKGEELHENIGYTGQIDGVDGFCRYVGTDPITMQIDIDFALGRGPKAEGMSHTYQYFVAVTRRDRVVLKKEVFPLKVDFKNGQQVVRVREKIEGIEIPRATETVSGSNFEVLVGFEVTPEQLEFNRAGKRFRMKVE